MGAPAALRGASDYNTPFRDAGQGGIGGILEIFLASGGQPPRLVLPGCGRTTCCGCGRAGLLATLALAALANVYGMDASVDGLVFLRSWRLQEMVGRRRQVGADGRAFLRR